MIQQLELLAPARDAATAIAAINHGADAVYIGAPAFGARAAATNSVEDIARVCDYAHQFGARVYVTLNTLIYNDELDAARRLIVQLWQIGVDALIVQDMAVLEMDIPPIDLHASTQTDGRTPEKAAMLARAGFSQIVLPREFTLAEITEAAKAASPAAIEVFVHGALCVSYSGDCQAGYALGRRSANRGECPQVCRLPFTLTDGEGRAVRNLPDGGNATRHWLSLADMNRLDYLADLAAAGASSFKIEGRLKSEAYVKNVTAAYSRALDDVVLNSGGRYCRASFGRCDVAFAPDASKSFNRGFTPFFLNSGRQTGITSMLTPKWVGAPIGKFVGRKGQAIRIESDAKIANGDGLAFFNEKGEFTGFRVNRAEGNLIFPAPGAELPARPGTQLYRNGDTEFEAQLSRAGSSRRTIGLNMTLRAVPDGRVALDIADERGCGITVAAADAFCETARSPQSDFRRGILSRLGDTIYRLDSLDDTLGDTFISSKALTALRRRGLEALDADWRIRRPRRLRGSDQLGPEALAGLTTTYHDNVANRLAERFYRQHGAKVAEKAAEAEMPRGEMRVMTCRYCLRRELGACLKGENAAALPGELYLNAPIGNLRLEFDCERCQMLVYAKPKQTDTTI